ncbi:MAG: hypothetical protein C0467_03095 [Planctomycetaceae bacterium]|nr:hypothetical protein [Planctomycetaceae bacterium]
MPVRLATHRRTPHSGRGAGLRRGVWPSGRPAPSESRLPDRAAGGLPHNRSTSSPHLARGFYLLTPPALVVEVRSKNDSQPEIDAKVQQYLAAGVVLVWVADPELRTVTAYRANQPPTVFAATDTLTADPVIPGFAVPIAELLPA